MAGDEEHTEHPTTVPAGEPDKDANVTPAESKKKDDTSPAIPMNQGHTIDSEQDTFEDATDSEILEVVSTPMFEDSVEMLEGNETSDTRRADHRRSLTLHQELLADDQSSSVEDNVEDEIENPKPHLVDEKTHADTSSSTPVEEHFGKTAVADMTGDNHENELRGSVGGNRADDLTNSKDSFLAVAPDSADTSSGSQPTEAVSSVGLRKDSIDRSKVPVSPSLPLRSPSVSSGFMGSLAGKLPGFHTAVAPLSSPPVLDKKLPPNPPPAHTRKATGPFSWLTRKETATPKEAIVSPTALPSQFMERRNTQVSVGSDTDANRRDNEDNAESGISGRNNLKDRFKLLRMRDEAGIPLGEEAEGGSIAALARSAGLSSPKHETSPHSPGLPSPGSMATISSVLAPGTVAGVAAGPTTATEAVDWDLWQAVVYEGPVAVARTSPEELNKAIATGIPGTIRGVVWQVLAQSKNDELESVYRDLVSRGSERNSQSSSSTVFGSIGSSSKEPASSASSVHSDDQNLTVSNSTNGLRSPSPHKDDSEAIAKAQAVERQRKAKEDAASLAKLEKTIKRDLGARTSFSKFAASAGLQDGLFGICKAYALFDEGVGYAQGMNFLVMPLLFNMPEEEAFCLLVRLMNQYHLRDLFIQDMPGLHMHLYQFERLLEDLEPALYCHLKRRQVTPHLYATQWFLTLFAYRFPLQLVLRIYDLILSEGLEAILKFGIVLMQKNVPALLAIDDMGALTSFLRDKLFDVYIDQSPSAGSILDSGFFGNAGASIDKEVYRADMLVQDACGVKITPGMLKSYAAEWEEKTRTEKAQLFEMESLKSSNSALTTKVRRLEERVQEHDSEHAALATELVRTKVENEELKDENESLKGQVTELRSVVERQPGEVEERLKQEMDRLMVRNQEVHSDNTKLEEDLVDMEKNLVQTKMALAEIKEENESINQRLSNMRKALE